MRVLWFLIPAIVVATMLQGRMPINCDPAKQVCMVAPVSVDAPMMCCMVARACAMQCAEAHEVPPPCVPCVPMPGCRICCTLCEPGMLAVPEPLLVLTSVTLWPNLDPSYPIISGVERAQRLARYAIPPRPPDATAHRALLCCWLT